MSEIQTFDSEIYKVLVENKVAQKFADMMMKRAEMLMRAIPVTVQENRPLVEGQVILCLELADGAKSALNLAVAKAKAAAEGRNPEDYPFDELSDAQTESLG